MSSRSSQETPKHSYRTVGKGLWEIGEGGHGQPMEGGVGVPLAWLPKVEFAREARQGHKFFSLSHCLSLYLFVPPFPLCSWLLHSYFLCLFLFICSPHLSVSLFSISHCLPSFPCLPDPSL